MDKSWGLFDCLGAKGKSHHNTRVMYLSLILYLCIECDDIDS